VAKRALVKAINRPRLSVSYRRNIFPLLFWRRFPILDVAAGDINHLLGEVGWVAGAFYADMGFRHRDSSDEE
jgi:hypothetical protein